jgi:hypothetical protein
MEELLKAGFFPEDSRPMIEALDPASYNHVDTLGRSIVDDVNRDKRRVTFNTQVTMLLQREWRNILRNKKALAARFVFTIMMSFLLGIIFWQIGDRSLASFPVSMVYSPYHCCREPATSSSPTDQHCTHSLP